MNWNTKDWEEMTEEEQLVENMKMNYCRTQQRKRTTQQEILQKMTTKILDNNQERVKKQKLTENNKN